MADRNVSTSAIGRIAGQLIAVKRCQLPAPSIAAASYSSWSTDVVAAYKLKATNGMACQTTSNVMIPNVETPVENHEWLTKSPPRLVSTQLTIPNCVSNSHWKM